jgi:transposase
MLFSTQEKLWLYRQPIDFRKQIDGIMLFVAEQLQLDPTSGHYFIFRNRGANKLKILWWDRNGFWLFYKRLEKGCFKLPKVSGETLELDSHEFMALMSGLDFQKQSFFPKFSANNFY